ncbi:hypothetical protein FB107DRAFT_279629 [Schizophyllum commune]
MKRYFSPFDPRPPRRRLPTFADTSSDLGDASRSVGDTFSILDGAPTIPSNSSPTFGDPRPRPRRRFPHLCDAARALPNVSQDLSDASRAAPTPSAMLPVLSSTPPPPSPILPASLPTAPLPFSAPSLNFAMKSRASLGSVSQVVRASSAALARSSESSRA